MFLNTLFEKKGTYAWVYFFFVGGGPIWYGNVNFMQHFLQIVEISQGCALE